MFDSTDTWIAVTGALCAAACALPGCFLVLRKMSMMGDAISHAVLPGLAIAFIVTGTRTSVPMFLGAAVTGVLTAVFTQWINRFGNVDKGAAMGIVFTTLFAVGLILIRQVDHIDLDASCVLYGSLESVILDRVGFLGFSIPRATLVNGGVLLFNVVVIWLFYKELRLSAFDPSLSDTLGFSSGFLHYLLMTVVAVTTVAAFESVGSIIVIAMLIVPPAAALLLTRRLFPMLVLSVVIGVAASFLGQVLTLTIPPLFGFKDTTTSGMIAFATGLLFVMAWLFSPAQGLLMKRKSNESEKAGSEMV